MSEKSKLAQAVDEARACADPGRDIPIMNSGRRPFPWGDFYLRFLNRGMDNADAAYRADLAEKRWHRLLNNQEYGQ